MEHVHPPDSAVAGELGGGGPLEDVVCSHADVVAPAGGVVLAGLRDVAACPASCQAGIRVRRRDDGDRAVRSLVQRGNEDRGAPRIERTDHSDHPVVVVVRIRAGVLSAPARVRPSGLRGRIVTRLEADRVTARLEPSCLQLSPDRIVDLDRHRPRRAPERQARHEDEIRGTRSGILDARTRGGLG